MGCAASTSPRHGRSAGSPQQPYLSQSVGGDATEHEDEEEEHDTYFGPHDYPSELASDGDVCSESRLKVALRQTYHSMVGYMKHGINGDINQFPADPVEPLSQHAASTIAGWVDFTTVSGCIMGMAPVVRLRGRCLIKSPSESAISEASPTHEHEPPPEAVGSDLGSPAPAPDVTSISSAGSIRSVATQGSTGSPAAATTAGVTTIFQYGLVEAIRNMRHKVKRTSGRREDRAAAGSPTGSAVDGQPQALPSPFSKHSDYPRGGAAENPASTGARTRSPSNVTFTTENFNASPRGVFSPQSSFGRSPFSPTQSFGGFGPMHVSRANSVSVPAPEVGAPSLPQEPKYRPPLRVILTAWNKILSADPTVKLDLSAGYEIGCQVDESGVPKKVTLHRRIDDPAFFTLMLREIVRCTAGAVLAEAEAAAPQGTDAPPGPSPPPLLAPVITNAVTVQVMSRFTPLPIPPAISGQGCVLGEPLSRSASKHSASGAFNEDASLSLPETTTSDPPPRTDSSGSVNDRRVEKSASDALCPLIKGPELPARTTSISAE